MTPTSSFRTKELSDPRFEFDGLRWVTVKSASLRMRGDITLYLPPGPDLANPLPIIILLHGVYGSHWSWAMKGGAHRTAKRLINEGSIDPFILAMPSDGLKGDGSGYIEYPTQNFERWIVEEVPLAVAEATPLASSESPLFIAGLSMGGFGALRLGAKYPERFQAISGHSSITRMEEMYSFVEEDLQSVDLHDKDVLSLLVKNQLSIPSIRFDCGISDPLLEANRSLSQGLIRAGIDHIYQEFPGGHEWSYWEEHLVDTLHFLIV